MLIYGVIVWLDSSSLTAGTAGTAEPSRRGATLAVHSMLGYIGGFVGPLAVGWVLDLQGGMSSTAWAAAFSMIAALMLMALVVFLIMRPRALAGDRGRRANLNGAHRPSLGWCPPPSADKLNFEPHGLP